MKLALLVGAQPRSSNGGPRVKLPKGNWKLGSDVVDSELFVDHYISDLALQSEIKLPCNVVGPCHVQVMFQHRGNESHISVYAELNNGT